MFKVGISFYLQHGGQWKRWVDIEIEWSNISMGQVLSACDIWNSIDSDPQYSFSEGSQDVLMLIDTVKKPKILSPG